MENLTSIQWYCIVLSLLLVFSITGNIISHFETKDLKELLIMLGKENTSLRMQLQRMPSPSKLLHNLKARPFRLITRDQAGNIITKILSPRKDTKL